MRVDPHVLTHTIFTTASSVVHLVLGGGGVSYLFVFLWFCDLCRVFAFYVVAGLFVCLDQ